MTKKYEEMGLLEKLDFWSGKYDVDLYLTNVLCSAVISKSDVKINKWHDRALPSVAIRETVLFLEKANPKAIRDHNKKCKKEVD